MITPEQRDEIARWIYDDHGIPMWLSRKIVKNVLDAISADTTEDEPTYQLVECPNCGDIWSEEIRQED